MRLALIFYAIEVSRVQTLTCHKGNELPTAKASCPGLSHRDRLTHLGAATG